MANSFNVSSLVSKQLVQSLNAQGKLIHTVNQSYSKDFTQKKYTPGTTVSMDIMHQPTVTSGRVANVQDVENRTTSVTIAQWNSAESFTSIEKGYSMDNEKDVKRYANDMAARLVRQIELDGFTEMMKKTGKDDGKVTGPVVDLREKKSQEEQKKIKKGKQYIFKKGRK